jgi:hypothetical protein
VTDQLRELSKLEIFPLRSDLDQQFGQSPISKENVFPCSFCTFHPTLCYVLHA